MVSSALEVVLMRVFVCIFILFFCSFLYSGLSFSTGPTQARIGSDNVLMGTVRVIMNGDDFANASPESPIYQRINVTAGVLKHSLVADGDMPVYLPLFLNSDHGELTAPADSIAVIRWVAGEDSIWVRIQQSSSTWVSVSDQLSSPSEEHSVHWYFGISASESAERLDAIPENQKNLPFSTRDVTATREQTELAISSILCYDLSNVQETTISIGVQHFEDLAAEHELDIDASSGGDLVRLFPKDCVATITAEGASVSEGVMYDQLSFTATCETILSSYMFENSFIDVSVHEDAAYGFAENSLRFSTETDGFFEVDLNSAFTLNEETLYRRGRLHYVGSPHNIPEEPLTVNAEMPVNGVSEVLVDYEIVINESLNPQDESPFDSDHQHRFCGLSTFSLDSGQWRMVFDDGKMIPHLTSLEGGFTTELIFSNRSDAAKNVRLEPYTANGMAIAAVEVVLSENETKKMSATTLFGASAVSHCRMFGDEDVASVIQYQLDVEGSGPAHGHIDGNKSKTWTFFSGNESRTWDGFAIVNQGSLKTLVTCSQYGPDGSLIASRVLSEEIEPNQKILGLLSDYFDWVEGAKYVIEAEQELSMIALRGDHSSLFLWQNAAIPH